MTRPFPILVYSTIFLALVISPQEPASPQRTAAYHELAMDLSHHTRPELVEMPTDQMSVLFIRAIKNRWNIIRRNQRFMRKTAPSHAGVHDHANCDHFYVGAGRESVENCS